MSIVGDLKDAHRLFMPYGKVRERSARTLYIENTINKTFKSSKCRSNYRLVNK